MYAVCKSNALFHTYTLFMPLQIHRIEFLQLEQKDLLNSLGLCWSLVIPDTGLNLIKVFSWENSGFFFFLLCFLLILGILSQPFSLKRPYSLSLGMTVLGLLESISYPWTPFLSNLIAFLILSLSIYPSPIIYGFRLRYVICSGGKKKSSPSLTSLKSFIL